jgi:beta-glucosidase
VRLVKAAEATRKPVVIACMAGRQPMITSLIKKADALLVAYLPGSEAGHAVADVPMAKGVRLDDGSKTTPLFPYGAGLTYRKSSK